jgi:hypothetical protein
VFQLVAAAASLKNGAADALTVKGAFHAAAGVPAAAPDVTVRFGFFEFAAPGAQFRRVGDKWSFQQKGVGTRTVTLDYAKGLFTVSLKGVELGSYEKGVIPVRVGVDFGEVLFEDTPDMTSTGGAVRY